MRQLDVLYENSNTGEKCKIISSIFPMKLRFVAR